jgi:5-methylcytosine-specific restriction endonuclease McrA
VPFDEELRERVQAEWRKHAEARYQESQAKRAQENDQWWADYDAYRQTPEWRERRRLVLERDNYVCQACRQRRATQAHHLTYKHLKREPLFDLVAVCKPCHDALHNRDQEQEAAA